MIPTTDELLLARLRDHADHDAWQDFTSACYPLVMRIGRQMPKLCETVDVGSINTRFHIQLIAFSFSHETGAMLYRFMQLPQILSLIVATLSAVLLCGNGVGEDRIRLTVSDFERTRMLAQMWVPRSELNIPRSDFTSDNEEEFRLIWKDLGEAASKVKTSWNRAIKTDALIAKALDCLNRSNDLSVPFNVLRNSIRAEIDRRALAQLEKEGAVWLQRCGLQWLDLEDRELLLLYLRCGGFIDRLKKGKKIADDAPMYGWLAKSSPGAEFIETSDDVLSEDDAIRIWRRGLEQHREHWREDRDRLRKNLNAPDALWAYLQIREESDSLGVVGETYLQVRLSRAHPNIAKEEKEFKRLFQRAVKVCPSLMKAIYGAHQAEMEQDVERLKKLHEELISKPPRGS